LLPLAPQVSPVGNAALVEREAVTLPLDHAFGFEFADIGPAAIKMLRQCRRADGQGLGGSPSRDRLGDGRPSLLTSVIVSFLLRRGGIAHFHFRRHSVTWAKAKVGLAARGKARTACDLNSSLSGWVP
jgi:hypothetical protein